MTILASAAFELVSQTLPNCEAEQSSVSAIRVAESLGFVEKECVSQHELVNYLFVDSVGDSITLTERWHDPSGPFQNLPDIHRIRLTLTVVGKAQVQHMAEYEN